MTTLDRLRAIRQLIDTPEKWCKGAYAKDAQGNFAHELSPSAVCFCLRGAQLRVWDVENPEVDIFLDGALLALVRQIDGYSTIPAFNDALSTTHADVLAVIDRAIAEEEDLYES